MIRNALLASALILGAGVAHAESGPVLVGGLGAGGARVERTAPASIVGGGSVQLSGGGNDRAYSYSSLNAQPGRIGRLVGGGDEARVVYEDAPQAAGLAAAGRTVTGG